MYLCTDIPVCQCSHNLRSALLIFTMVVVTVTEHRRATYIAPRLQLPRDSNIYIYMYIYIHMYLWGYAWRWGADTEGLLGSRPAPRLLCDPIHIYMGLRMACSVQAPRALVALDLYIACYATPYIGHRRVIQLRDPTHIHKAPQGSVLVYRCTDVPMYRHNY